MDGTDTGNAIIAAVLGGKLPDEAHEAMLSRFWELYPQLHHMRGVINAVVAERRATASLHASKVHSISERWKSKRDAVWDELFATLLDGFDGSQEAKDACDRRIENAKARARKIMDIEIAEIKEAHREDAADFKHCFHILVWHHEREVMRSMRPKVRCV